MYSYCMELLLVCCVLPIIQLSSVINPRRACAERVPVVVSCVCMSVCLSEHAILAVRAIRSITKPLSASNSPWRIRHHQPMQTVFRSLPLIRIHHGPTNKPRIAAISRLPSRSESRTNQSPKQHQKPEKKLRTETCKRPPGEIAIFPPKVNEPGL